MAPTHSVWLPPFCVPPPLFYTWAPPFGPPHPPRGSPSDFSPVGRTTKVGFPYFPVSPFGARLSPPRCWRRKHFSRKRSFPYAPLPGLRNRGSTRPFSHMPFKGKGYTMELAPPFGGNRAHQRGNPRHVPPGLFSPFALVSHNKDCTSQSVPGSERATAWNRAADTGFYVRVMLLEVRGQSFVFR